MQASVDEVIEMMKGGGETSSPEKRGVLGGGGGSPGNTPARPEQMRAKLADNLRSLSKSMNPGEAVAHDGGGVFALVRSDDAQKLLSPDKSSASGALWMGATLDAVASSGPVAAPPPATPGVFVGPEVLQRLRGQAEVVGARRGLPLQQGQVTFRSALTVWRPTDGVAAAAFPDALAAVSATQTIPSDPLAGGIVHHLESIPQGDVLEFSLVLSQGGRFAREVRTLPGPGRTTVRLNVSDYERLRLCAELAARLKDQVQPGAKVDEGGCRVRYTMKHYVPRFMGNLNEMTLAKDGRGAVGLVVASENDTANGQWVRVDQVIDAAAREAGLLPGTRIFSVNGREVRSEEEYDWAVRLMAGSTVKVETDAPLWTWEEADEVVVDEGGGTISGASNSVGAAVAFASVIVPVVNAPNFGRLAAAFGSWEDLGQDVAAWGPVLCFYGLYWILLGVAFAFDSRQDDYVDDEGNDEQGPPPVTITLDAELRWDFLATAVEELAEAAGVSAARIAVVFARHARPAERVRAGSDRPEMLIRVAVRPPAVAPARAAPPLNGGPSAGSVSSSDEPLGVRAPPPGRVKAEEGAARLLAYLSKEGATVCGTPLLRLQVNAPRRRYRRRGCCWRRRAPHRAEVGATSGLTAKLQEMRRDMRTHQWVCVFFRAKASVYTRTRRVTVLASFVLSVCAFTAVLFDNPENGRGVRVVTTGIFVALMLSPVTVILSVLFRRAQIGTAPQLKVQEAVIDKDAPAVTLPAVHGLPVRERLRQARRNSSVQRAVRVGVARRSSAASSAALMLPEALLDSAEAMARHYRSMQQARRIHAAAPSPKYDEDQFDEAQWEASTMYTESCVGDRAAAPSQRRASVTRAPPLVGEELPPATGIRFRRGSRAAAHLAGGRHRQAGRGAPAAHNAGRRDSCLRNGLAADERYHGLPAATPPETPGGSSNGRSPQKQDPQPLGLLPKQDTEPLGLEHSSSPQHCPAKKQPPPLPPQQSPDGSPRSGLGATATVPVCGDRAAAFRQKHADVIAAFSSPGSGQDEQEAPQKAGGDTFSPGSNPGPTPPPPSPLACRGDMSDSPSCYASRQPTEPPDGLLKDPAEFCGSWKQWGRRPSMVTAGPSGLPVEVAVPRRPGERLLGLRCDHHTRLSGVVPGGPADRCGLGAYAGHRVTAVDGQPVYTLQQMRERIAASASPVVFLQLAGEGRIISPFGGRRGSSYVQRLERHDSQRALAARRRRRASQSSGPEEVLDMTGRCFREHVRRRRASEISFFALHGLTDQSGAGDGPEQPAGSAPAFGRSQLNVARFRFQAWRKWMLERRLNVLPVKLVDEGSGRCYPVSLHHRLTVRQVAEAFVLHVSCSMHGFDPTRWLVSHKMPDGVGALRVFTVPMEMTIGELGLHGYCRSSYYKLRIAYADEEFDEVDSQYDREAADPVQQFFDVRDATADPVELRPPDMDRSLLQRAWMRLWRRRMFLVVAGLFLYFLSWAYEIEDPWVCVAAAVGVLAICTISRVELVCAIIFFLGVGSIFLWVALRHSFRVGLYLLITWGMGALCLAARQWRRRIAPVLIGAFWVFTACYFPRIIYEAPAGPCVLLPFFTAASYLAFYKIMYQKMDMPYLTNYLFSVFQIPLFLLVLHGIPTGEWGDIEEPTVGQTIGISASLAVGGMIATFCVAKLNGVNHIPDRLEGLRWVVLAYAVAFTWQAICLLLVLSLSFEFNDRNLIGSFWLACVISALQDILINEPIKVLLLTQATPLLKNFLKVAAGRGVTSFLESTGVLQAIRQLIVY